MVTKRPGGEPLERRWSTVAGCPDHPAVPLFGNGTVVAGGHAIRPAGAVIEGVDHSGWTTGVEVVARGMTEALNGNEHRHGTACTLCKSKSVFHKGIGKAPPVGRVGDDVARTGS